MFEMARGLGAKSQMHCFLSLVRHPLALLEGGCGVSMRLAGGAALGRGEICT